MTDQDLVILVPVLRRPHRVKPLLDTIAATTPGARVLFIPDPDDAKENYSIRGQMGRPDIRAVERLQMQGGWAKKLNAAVRATNEPLLFLGADDLEFRPGWFPAATAQLTPGVGLVGVNDMIRRRRIHTTHFLITREYALLPCLDGTTGPCCEAYDHSFVDDELIATAHKRGAYAYAPGAFVKHHHPLGGGGTDDPVYRKGRRRFHSDQQRFLTRSHLWT